MSQLTEAQLKTLCYSPGAEEVAQSFTSALASAMERFDIKTLPQRAMFLSQVIEESNSFRHLQENLNYSATTLQKIWPNHFNENAENFAHKPEQIANRAYANRMGNGDEDSGDGWRYRARGLIQITGRNQYAYAADGTQVDIVANPDLLLQPDTSALVAAWWWSSHGLNELVSSYDQDDDEAVKRVTMKINGGLMGLAERIAAYQKSLEILD